MKIFEFLKRNKVEYKQEASIDEAKEKHKKFMKKLDSNNIKNRIKSRRKRKQFYQNSKYFNNARLEMKNT